MGQTLDHIVNHSDHRQAYLTGNYDNTTIVAAALKRMGLGDEFEVVGSGDAALVIAPTFTNDIVIRLGTEFEEPDKWCYNPLSGLEEKMFRPQIPQVLQALHTEKVRVAHNPEFSATRSTDMRIEILPRLQTFQKGDDQNKWEGYGTRLMQELRIAGYKINDPKPQNIGLLANRTKSPVFLDPGEIEMMSQKERIFAKADILSLLTAGVKRRTTGYQWTFEDQRAQLGRDWKGFIVEHQKTYDKELDTLMDTMLSKSVEPSESRAKKLKDRPSDQTLAR